MRDSVPNFQPFPYAQLARCSRRDAAAVSAVARWMRARPAGAAIKLAALLGGPVAVRLVGLAVGRFDPYAAFAEVRVGGVAFAVAGSSSGMRAIAQRILGGPPEVDAPRPLTLAERALLALVIAAALVDAGIAGEAWPLDGPPAWVVAPPPPAPRDATLPAHGAARREDVGRAETLMARAAGGVGIELALSGPLSLALVLYVPPGIELRVPPSRAGAWSLDLSVVVAACTLPRAAVAGLGLHDVVVVERGLRLELGDGAIGLAADPGAIEARVATGYGARPMIADDAHLELTVQLGSTRLPIRRLAELAVGEIIPLGRPLAGPYEIRAGGRLIGRGELIDVDGELGVRIVSIESAE